MISEAIFMVGDGRLDDSKRDQPKPDPFEGLGGALLSNPQVARVQETPKQRTQREYDQQHGQYLKHLDTYWQHVNTDKAAKHLVTDYPPIYKGPEKPPWDTTPSHGPSTLPNLTEMRDASKDLKRFASGNGGEQDFSISSIDEPAFKQRYASEVMRAGKQYGFSKNDVQNVVQSIYAFEDGGWGTHETLSNMPLSMVKPDKPGDTTIHDKRVNFRPGSTAVGYNQLLMYNTVKDVHQHGGEIASQLTTLAKNDPSRAKELNEKAKLLTDLSASLGKELKAMSLSDPAKYVDPNGQFTEALYSDFAKSKDATEYSKSLPATDPTKDNLTRRSLSIGIHGLNLDGDIGPIIQAQELDDLFKYAQQNNFAGLLAQAEATSKSDAAAFDALPGAAKLSGAHELLSLAHPPKGMSQAHFVATRDALEKKIANLQSGPDDAMTDAKLSGSQRALLDSALLPLRRFGEGSGALSSEARSTLDKIWYSRFGGPKASELMPAAVELANLAGTGNALGMITPANRDYPTVNWFERAGYEGNPVTNRRTANELLMQIFQRMDESNRSPHKSASQIDFDKAFAAIP